MESKMSCLIGFVDEEIKTEVDWSCNKFGGFPDWMLPGSRFPSCKLCMRKMYHVVQVYCPMEGSEYHRTLNMFACVNRECCSLHGSVCVLKSQKLEEKEVVGKKQVEDDWGTNDWRGSPEEDTSIASTENTPIKNHIEDSTSHLAQQMENFSLDEPHFEPHYIYVQTEDTLLTSEEKHTQDYREYIDTKGGSNEDGKYEKTKVKHGDVAFYKMHKKLSKVPGQSLRYHYNGRPLLLSDISKPSIPLDEIPACPACKKPRVFEMQLLPALVSQLRHNDVTNQIHNDVKESRNGASEQRNDVTNSRDNDAIKSRYNDVTLCNNDVTLCNNDVVWEFGSVYVYTCSCWHGDVMEEVAVLHADPEHLMLQKIQS